MIEFLKTIVRRGHQWVIGVFAVLAIAAGVIALHVRVDSSAQTYMIDGDLERELNRALKFEFSNDEVILIAFELGQPVTGSDLRRLRAISERLSQVDHVEEVLDLSTIEDVRSRGDGLDASPLVDFETLDDTRLDLLRDRIRNHRVYRANLVSEPLDVVAMIVIFDPRQSGSPVAHAATQRVVAIARELAPPWGVYISGFPVSEVEAFRIIQRDLSILTVVALLAVLLLVYYDTRRLLAGVLLVLLLAWSELVACAWLVISDTPLSMISSIVPTLLLATSATYAIYFLGLLRGVSEQPEPGVAVLDLLTQPVLISGVSTGIGFLALRFMDAESIRAAGTAAAVGIAASVAGTLLLLPALATHLDLRIPKREAPGLSRVADLGIRLAARPWLTVSVFLTVLVAAIPGLHRLRVHSDVLEHFSPQSDLRKSSAFIQTHLAGNWILNLVVRADGPESVLEPEVLGFTHELVQMVEADPIVDRTLSFLDYIALMDAALLPNEVPRTVLPSRAMAAQYLLLYEAGGDPEDYRHYINHDRSALNVFVRTNAGSSEFLHLRARVAEFAEEAPSGVTVQTLGSAYLSYKAMEGIATSMVTGLLTAGLLIVLVMAFTLRSVPLALIAAIPNATPILLCLSALGWLGWPLSMGTSMVGCIALGLAVDDTAHVLAHVTRGRPLRSVYAIVGKPLVLTTVALGSGFCALLLSEFETIAILGGATALTLLVALICDLWLLPSLLVLIGYER